MRKALAIGWLCILCVIVGLIFWYSDYRYNLPTPIPPNYLHVNNGQHIAVTKDLKFGGHKPLFLHFFNPDCPCSRFNIEHFRSLARQYGTQANFAVVLMTDKKYTAAEVKKRFELTMPVTVNPELAARCGVYSTPQAVIIDTAGKLYFRGNYNASRYCTDQKTEFARMALNALLKNNKPEKFTALALTAYGCSLPGCRK